jgi:hypothetical protein
MPPFASSGHPAACAACESKESGDERFILWGGQSPRAARRGRLSRLAHQQAAVPDRLSFGRHALKRLRVLARKIGSHIRAAFTTIHESIVAAKMRRIRRELIFHGGSHDDWSRSRWREGPTSDHDIRDFPQTPMILGDKWDS